MKSVEHEELKPDSLYGSFYMMVCVIDGVETTPGVMLPGTNIMSPLIHRSLPAIMSMAGTAAEADGGKLPDGAKLVIRKFKRDHQSNDIPVGIG